MPAAFIPGTTPDTLSIAEPLSGGLMDNQRSANFVRDYLSLTKPRIVFLVLITVGVGYLLGARGATHPLDLAVVILGTGLVAAGASVWNQYLERGSDRLMRRTSRRALPAGRINPANALVFGSILVLFGIGLLSTGSHPVSAVVALLTFILYAYLYTWLKPRTSLNTAVGAIPGALPPVIGWTAATGQLGIEPIALFMIMFLWQFPHFLAIAWLHREDYSRAGLRMLPRHDPDGSITGRQAAWHALVLLPVGLLPTAIGMAGDIYLIGAFVIGLHYLLASVQFWRQVSDASARRLLKASFFYLPAVLLLLLVNPLPA